MEKKVKKLQLNKRIVAKLDNIEMNEIAGGLQFDIPQDDAFQVNVVAQGFTGGCTDGCTTDGGFRTMLNCTNQNCTANCQTHTCPSGISCLQTY